MFSVQIILVLSFGLLAVSGSSLSFINQRQISSEVHNLINQLCQSNIGQIQNLGSLAITQFVDTLLNKCEDIPVLGNGLK